MKSKRIGVIRCLSDWSQLPNHDRRIELEMKKRSIRLSNIFQMKCAERDNIYPDEDICAELIRIKYAEPSIELPPSYPELHFGISSLKEDGTVELSCDFGIIEPRSIS